MFTYTLHQSDCITALEQLQEFQYDVICIDPPYNTKNNKNKTVSYDRNKDFQRKNWKNFYASWDAIDKYYAWCLRWLRLSKSILAPKASMFVCGSFHNIPDVAIASRKVNMYTVQWIQWCIPNAFPNLQMSKQINANQTIIHLRGDDTHYYDKEAAKRYNDGKNLRDYWLINNDTTVGKKWRHPSKKPIALIYRTLDISTRKDKPLRVLDFFAGSGTIGIAAQQLADTYGIDVHCDMVERDELYIKDILQRMSDETTGKGTLLRL